MTDHLQWLVLALILIWQGREVRRMTAAIEILAGVIERGERK